MASPGSHALPTTHATSFVCDGLLHLTATLTITPLRSGRSFTTAMSVLSIDTALHRLRRLYRDAHHCEPASDQHALEWAGKPELWATHQIRFRNWSWEATEATVREARRLFNRIQASNLQLQQGADPFDPLMPSQEPKV